MQHLMVVFAIVLMLAGVCGRAYAAPPQSNPVRSVEMEALDRLIHAEGFTGFMVAMTSWCGPCRKELPLLNQLFRKFEPRGIQIVAISLDTDGPGAVQQLINRLKIIFPVYWIGPKAIQKYRIFGVPMLIVIKNGELVKKIPGAQTRPQLEKHLRALLD